MKTFSISIITSLLLALAAGAQVSTSASYSLLHGESGESGGTVQNAGGTVQAEVGTAGNIAGGVSAVTAGGVQSKGGFTGQLYDPKALELSATPGTMNEAATSQLAGSARMDDDTTLALEATDIAWSVESGFLAGITPDGLATAGNVFANEIARAKGSWLGFEGFADISILNVGDDDFGSYAGDGLDDDWQVDFFGLENPDADPSKDPDGDEQNNELEFLTGFVPTDPTSLFSVRLEFVPGEPTHRNVIFPFIADRTYAVEASPDLDPVNFQALIGETTSDSGDERTVTDTDAADVRKFYKVKITKP